MDTSKFLSKVIGLYMSIVSISMLVDMSRFSNDVKLLMNDTPSMLLAGYIALIIGLLMVVSHPIWQRNWRVIVTLIAWIILLKGICILLFPQVIDEVTIAFLKNTTLQYSFVYLDLGIGILLCYFGFRRAQ